ncbi:MAG: four helix bundle protein [Candidatus Aenigmarchaeota archaeon]|nr:four helix bundle protein [Candidatus Aenigmarchaeota archaeon]
MYSELFQKTYELLRWVYPVVNKFPRKQRLILSQRIEVTTIRILELVIDLSESNTADKMKKIMHEIHKLQILFRICKDLSYMSFKDYECASVMLNELSAMLNGEGYGKNLRKFV